MRKLFYISCLLLAALWGCSTKEDPANYKWREEWKEPEPQEPDEPENPDNPGLPEIKGKPRYVWVDAAANFQYYANDAAYIEADCRRIAQMGFTDIIVDVRPTSGDVLFASAVAPACSQVAAWVNGNYKWVVRSATFDYLGAFIAAGHAAGLRVNAAINTMVGAYHSSLGDVGMLYDHPERKSWCAVDNLADGGLTNALDDPDTGPRFLDPANPQVQEFLLTLLGELASYEGLDGIVLDRCRYDDYNLDAGYTDAALEAFTNYLGEAPKDWPLIPQGTTYLSSPTALQRHWLTFRCKTIHDFVSKAAQTVHGVNPDIRFGVYVGAWFSEYYRAGVNWTSATYDLKANESTYKWVSAAYQKTGFADLLDFIFLGAYAGTNGIHGSGEWTMEGFAKLGAKRLCGVVPFAAGPDVGNGTGFENGHQEEIIPDIVNTMMANSGGLFIFDLCHIRMFDYWNAFEEAVNSYLKTL
ncbi:MAG: family 10 glycosylhydrolase [Bacteroidales bacterium]|nr:family 10 glycosylhydrolase [Bacteroidales bacterium]